MSTSGNVFKNLLKPIKGSGKLLKGDFKGAAKDILDPGDVMRPPTVPDAPPVPDVPTLGNAQGGATLSSGYLKRRRGVLANMFGSVARASNTGRATLG